VFLVVISWCDRGDMRGKRGSETTYFWKREKAPGF
jgi:hypothetical protein